MITDKEWEYIIVRVRELQNENNKLKGYIEGIEKKLTLTDFVKQSEMLLCGVCDEETKHDTSNLKELRCLKCNNVAKE
jgi:hypothetical protein